MIWLKLIKFFFVLAFASFSSIYATSVELFINAQNHVTEPVVQILAYTGIRIENTPLPEGNDYPEPKLWLKSSHLEEVTKAVQGKADNKITWLSDQARWHMSSVLITSEAQAQRIVDICLNKLAFKDAINPESSLEGVILNGSTVPSFRKVLAFVNDCIDTGLEVKQAFVLTGKRQLDPKAGESEQDLVNPNNGMIGFKPGWHSQSPFPTDEGDMVKMVLEQSAHAKLNHYNFVYAQNSHKERATTDDTVKQWVADFPNLEEGIYGSFSRQPFILRQELGTNRLLKQLGSKAKVKGYGPGISEQELKYYGPVKAAAILLDNLSRLLYELTQIKSYN